MADAQLPIDDHQGAVPPETDTSVSQLISQHHALDEQIRDLSAHIHPSDQLHFEEIALKKRKLALKDRIEAILHGRGVMPAEPRRA
jgi:uncharacterized protein YdcH (DUF465 family)